MQVRKRKLATGRYRVTFNGRDSSLIIERGEPAKFGMRQGWDVGIERDDKSISWLIYDQPGLDSALAVIAIIKEA